MNNTETEIGWRLKETEVSQIVFDFDSDGNNDNFPVYQLMRNVWRFHCDTVWFSCQNRWTVNGKKLNRKCTCSLGCYSLERMNSIEQNHLYGCRNLVDVVVVVVVEKSKFPEIIAAMNLKENWKKKWKVVHASCVYCMQLRIARSLINSINESSQYPYNGRRDSLKLDSEMNTSR